MKGLVIFALFLMGFTTVSLAQDNEESAVKEAINHLFTGMKTGDSTLTRAAFAPNAVMQTIVNKDGKTAVRAESVSDFVKLIGTPHKEIYDERILFTKILIDGPLASVWTDYQFYLGEKFSHCGVNSFQLVKEIKVGKLFTLLIPGGKEGCK